MAEVRVTGVQTAIRAISKARTEAAIRIVDGIDKCCDSALKKARFYVPKDTMALHDSGRKEVTGSGMGAKGRVIFGGPSAPYAIYVHEIQENQHAPPTCAKFLERAVRELRGTMSNIMKREIIAKTSPTQAEEE